MPLSVSPFHCQPLKRGGKTYRGTCAECKIEVDGGLERHIVAKDPKTGKIKVEALCPICHCTRHLDVAGDLKAGKIIYVPDADQLTQARITSLFTAIFVAIMEKRRRSNGSAEDEGSDLAQHVARLRILGESFDSRGKQVEHFFAGSGALFKPMSPYFFAQQIQRHLTAGMAAQDISKALAGFYFLPDPFAFKDFLPYANRSLVKAVPIDQWRGLAKAYQDLSDHEAAA
jgi:hypothetical protein